MLRKRKFQYLLCILGTCLTLVACQHDWDDVDPGGKLNIPQGFQISLDTVLGNTGSPVYRFNFTNPGSKAIVYTQVYLKSGTDSPFLLNVDGQSGTALRDIRVLGKDSIYLFIQAKTNTTTHRAYIRDTLVLTNAQTVQEIPIRAYMEQVIEVKDRWIWTGQTTFSPNASYLIEKGLEVPQGETVNIPAGIHFYLIQNDSTCIVNGTLSAHGTAENPIVFSSNRTDQYYHSKAGQWAGLTFASSNNSHYLKHVHIRNANTAVNIGACSLTAESCILSNSTCGVSAGSANIILSNCLLYGHWMKTLDIRAGSLRMTHCALFANKNRGGVLMQVCAYVDSAGQSYNKPTHLLVCNSIIYGSLENEILLKSNQNPDFNAQFISNLLRVNEYYWTQFAACWPSASNWRFDPLFINPDMENFTLSPISPARNKGVTAAQAGYTDTAFEVDILDQLRGLPPQLGPYSTP